MVFRATILSVSALALLTTPAWSQPVETPSVSAGKVEPVRCDDWKKVGEHRWMVMKEVMLGTARRTGTIVANTPETDALDANCSK